MIVKDSLMTDDLTIMEDETDKKDLETLRCNKNLILKYKYVKLIILKKFCVKAAINYHVKPLTETPTSDLYLSMGELDLNKSKTSKRGEEVKLNLTG
jgi:hypothetical protein